MYRHSPARNPRSKGIKKKHVLQGFLLVVICFWLIFQVKRSHDKKKEFDVHDNKMSLSSGTRGSDEIVILGRKDIQPKIEGTTKENEIHEDTQEDEDEHEEHEDNKHEEEDQEEDKVEEEKDDGGGGGDDEIDESEQEKSDVEIDRDEVDIIDEDKETEEHDEKETGEKDGQSQSHTENEGSTVSHDAHTNEAREENYKADDASSAVTHNGRNLGTENESKNGTLDNSSGDVGLVDNGQTAKNMTSSNVTMTQEKDYESIVTSLNATSSINSQYNGPPSGTTMITSDSTEAQNVTALIKQDGNSSIDASVGDQLVSNATLTKITEGSLSNSTNDTEEKSSDPSKTEDETNEGENSGTNNVTEGTEEILDTDDVERDAIDSTDPSHLEENEVRTDLDTLPEIETEGSNSEDTAAE